jgi:hypothetical protein
MVSDHGQLVNLISSILDIHRLIVSVLDTHQKEKKGIGHTVSLDVCAKTDGSYHTNPSRPDNQQY